jgi:hypothetical protein
MFLGSMSRSGSYLSADTGMAKVPAGAWFATLWEYTVTAGRLAVSCENNGWAASASTGAALSKGVRSLFIRADR